MGALRLSPPVEAATSDPPSFKPCFNGKLPQSPRVIDLAAQGFPLAGGRIDVIGLTPAPTLVYRAPQHVISLTALPLSPQAGGALPPVHGHNLGGRGRGARAPLGGTALSAPPP